MTYQTWISAVGRISRERFNRDIERVRNLNYRTMFRLGFSVQEAAALVAAQPEA